MRTIVKHSAILIAAALLTLLCASAATAGTGAGGISAKGGIGAGNLDSSAYGSWYPQPTSNSSVSIYRGDLNPYNQTTPEALDFSCTYPTGPKTGMPIDNAVLAILSQLFQISRTVYSGDTSSANSMTPTNASPLDYDASGDSSRGWVIPAGYTNMADISNKGQNGLAMQYYLYHVVQQLKKFDATNTKGNPVDYGALGADLSGSSSNGQLTTQQIQDAVQNALYFIPTQNGSSAGANPGVTPGDLVNDPSKLDSLVPFDCQLNEFSNTSSGLTLSNLLHRPAEWLSDLFAYIPGLIVKGIYGTVEPLAFKYAFWTPHSERGDTIFNSTLDCSAASIQSQADLSPQAQAAVQNALLSNKTWCGYNQNGQVVSLGYSTDRLMIGSKDYNQMPSWIRYSIMAQWLISATYFIVLFGGAIIFMFRGHRRTAYNVMHMIPRLILAVFLTVFSNWAIGLLISLSNMLVVNLFGSNGDVADLRAMRDVITNLGTFGNTGGSFTSTYGGLTDTLTTWIQVFTVGAADWFLAVVAVASVLRQLLLVVLIIAAPVACFTLIHQRWEQKFKDYVRILLIVVGMPPAMALVLKIGLAVNPAIGEVATGSSAGFAMGFFGAVMGIITFGLLGKIPKIAWAGIKGGPMMGGGGAMGRFVQRMGKTAMPFAPWLGAAMQFGGAGMARAGQGLDKVGAHAATLAPDQKIRASHAGGRVGAPSRMSRRLAGNTADLNVFKDTVGQSQMADRTRGGMARSVSAIDGGREWLANRAANVGEDAKLGRTRSAAWKALGWGAKHGAGWSGIALAASPEAARKLGEHRSLRSMTNGVAASKREYRQQHKEWEQKYKQYEATQRRQGKAVELTKEQFFAALTQREGNAIQMVKRPGGRGQRYVRNTVRAQKPILAGKFEAEAVKNAREAATTRMGLIQNSLKGMKITDPEQYRAQAQSMLQDAVRENQFSPDLANSTLEELMKTFDSPAPASAPDVTTSSDGSRQAGGVVLPSGVKSV